MKTIVITGASTGIGAACALGLERAGFKVYAGVRSEAAGRDLAARSGGALVPLQLDVTDPASLQAALGHVLAEVGDAGLDALWNNAGISVNGPLEFVPLDELRRQFEVNVIGQVAVTQAFLPALRQARGRILITGSVGGFFTTPMVGPYCMSKRALEAMADALRVELRPWGIRVVLLQPGAIATPIWQKGLKESNQFETQAPDAMHRLYGKPLARVRRVVEKEERSSVSPEVVLKVAMHALTADKLKDRYVMGGGTLRTRVLSRLPVAWRDWLLARALGFNPD